MSFGFGTGLLNRLAVDKLRALLAGIDPQPAAPAEVTGPEYMALLEIRELGDIREVFTTFDGQGRLFAGLYGQFVIDAEIDSELRSKGLLTGGGRITAAGGAALAQPVDILFDQGRAI